MLSSVLNSERAIQVNIQIMRAFTKIREMLQTHKELWRKIEEMEQKYDQQFRVVFKALKELLEPPEKPKQKIGFRPQWVKFTRTRKAADAHSANLISTRRPTS